MNRNTELLSKRLLEISKELEQDLYLDETCIHEKSMLASGIKLKWINIKFEEEKVLERLEELKKKTEEKILNEIISNKEGNYPKHLLSTEMKRILDKDEKYNKILNKIEEEKEIIRYLDHILKVVMNFGFDIKNSIDVLKLEQ